MANSKSRSLVGRMFGWAIILVLVVLAALAWINREPAQAYASVATSYSARVVCSCRFVAGRSLEDCEKDKLSGMELVTLADNEANQSVTARFPLIAETTATYREGYGCVLEEWDG